MAVVSASEIAAAPFAGVVDRFDRRTVMIASDSIAALVTVVLLFIWSLDQLEPAILAVGGAGIGFVSTLQATAYTSAIPSLVERDALERANGLVQLGPAVAIVIGPALASAILATAGVGAILALDLATFTVGLSTAVLVRFTSRPSRLAEDDGSMMAAMSWLRHHGRPFIALIGVTALANLALGAHSVVTLGRAAQLGGDARAGWPVTAGGLAMVASGIAVGVVGLPKRRVRAIALGAGWFGCFTILAGARPTLFVLVLGVALSFAAIPLIQSAITTLFHERVPTAMHGRVLGLRSGIGMALLPVGSIAGGPAAEWSQTGVLAVIGGAFICIALALALGARGWVRSS